MEEEEEETVSLHGGQSCFDSRLDSPRVVRVEACGERRVKVKARAEQRFPGLPLEGAAAPLMNVPLKLRVSPTHSSIRVTEEGQCRPAGGPGLSFGLVHISGFILKE